MAQSHDHSGDEQFLISGATGTLGRELLGVLLRRHPRAGFILLAREKSGLSPDKRLDLILDDINLPAECGDPRKRITVLPADISKEKAGLSDEQRLLAVTGTTRVIHLAATVRFDLSLDDARAVNVGGTARMIALADEALCLGSLRSFTYVGTAFVAGIRTGLVSEDELDVGQKFRNTYEQTKFEAEELVRSHMASLPTVIARPSIIVGDSRTGVTASFKTLYWPLKIYARRWWRTVPADPDSVLDIVPVDFVAEAVAHLAIDPRAIGRSFHLCAGNRNSVTLGEVAQYAADFFGLPKVRFVNPDLFLLLLRPLMLATLWGRRRDVLRKGRLYRPYLCMDMQFDTSRACELLDESRIHAPKVTCYLDRLLRYCVTSDWGKRPVRESV